MAVQFVSASALVGGTTNLTVTRPVEWTAGMFALMVVFTNNANSINSGPDGNWTLVHKQTFRVMVWGKEIGPSEPSTYTVTRVGSGVIIAAVVGFVSDEGRPLFADAAAGGTSSGTVVSWPTVTTTTPNGHLIGFGNFGLNRGHAPGFGFTEVWDALVATSQRVYALRTVLGAAGLSPVMTASDAISNNLDAVTVAVAEGDIPIVSYEIADGHNQSRYDLELIDPQPRSTGVRVTRRDSSTNSRHKDDALYVILEWDMVESAAQYQSILSQHGVLSAKENEITFTARDQDQAWQRWNGTAVRPRINANVRRENFFIRNLQLLIKDIELAA